jgi:peptidoglycan-associated lipoprotein
LRARGGADALDETTEELFSDGLAALEAGQTERAQHLFEQMIARSPTSALAAQARRHLATLYRESQEPRGTGTSIGVALPPRREAEAAPSGSVPGDGGSKVPNGPVTGGLHRVSGALEQQFIAEAGDRVFFSIGSAELGGRARGVLAAQARFILRRSDLSAMIEGHADDASLTAEEHARLSEARAEAVRRRLLEEGVEAERLSIVAFGRARRVSECPEPECAAQNRRAVTVLMTSRVRSGYAPAGTGMPESAQTARGSAPLTH